MLNPHQGLKDWLNSMNTEELGNLPISFSSNPYFSSVEIISSQQDYGVGLFWQTINKYSEPNLESVDFFVVFKALIDFHYETFLNGKAWGGIENNHKKLLDHPDCSPDMEVVSNKILSSLPEQKEHWKKLSKSWEELKMNSLSNDNLENWRLEALCNSTSTTN